MIKLTGAQARSLLLLKHGLTGQYRFEGKQGALSFVRQAGCIQFDPVDVCGKNPELTLQSRVKGFTKAMLYSLLYEDRALIDCYDKNLAIVTTGDWPYFERNRETARKNAVNYPELRDLMQQVRDYIDAHGAVNSGELPAEMYGESNWRSAIHWSPGKGRARAALEQMYSEGKLIIHHKKGTRKFYDVAEKHIPPEILNAPDPLPGEIEHFKWRVKRRIGAVGLLWDRPSDAWLGILGIDTEKRKECFRQLLNEGELIEITVSGLGHTLYCCIEDMPLVEFVLGDPKLKPRCELIAPLDCLLWDRRLIKQLFDYDYTWEIYHPPNKRKYGYYVLPLIYGNGFIGRMEAAADRKTKTMIVKNIWYEEHTRHTKVLKRAIDDCIKRFAGFNECSDIRDDTFKINCQGNKFER